MKITNPIRYPNGNCTITICRDGTTCREWPDGEPPRPAFPCSIDFKVTDYCDGGCRWCHESSTTSGKHAKLAHAEALLNGLPRGVEIALGGGNPFDWPVLTEFLCDVSDRLIVNVTVNAMHLGRAIQGRFGLSELRHMGYINALGITYIAGLEDQIVDACDESTVIHMIAGVHQVSDAIRLLADNRKVLVLGFKQYGRAVDLSKSVAEWKSRRDELLTGRGVVISFDNLAIEQLGIREAVPESVWRDSYMGNDGQFTFYIDAVKMEYAVSSVSPRFPLVSGMTAVDAFRELQAQKHDAILGTPQNLAFAAKTLDLLESDLRRKT